MKTRTVLYAEEGKVLTNGITYGIQIFLAEGEKSEEYYEITQEEYDRVLAEEDAKSKAQTEEM